MREPYRLELFDAPTLTCIGVTTIASPTIIDDCLTMETSELICADRIIGAEMYNFARVLDADGQEIMQGVVYDVQEGAQTTTILIKPMTSLLDRDVFNFYVNVYPDPKEDPYIVSIPGLIAEQFRSMYRGVPASFPAIETDVTASWVVTTDTQLLNIFTVNSYNLLDVARDLMYNTGAVTRVSFDPGRQSVKISITEAADLPPRGQTVVVECDAQNVLAKTAMLTAAGEAYNTCVVIYTIRDSETGDSQTSFPTVYTDKTTGELTQSTSNAQLPIIQTITDIGTFDAGKVITTEQIIAAAREVLQPRAEQHEIEITVRADDKLVTIGRESIGKPVRVIFRGVTYDTVLTAVQFGGMAKTLTFGYARADLTKQLLIERRSTR